MGIPIRKSQVLRLRAAPLSLSQLGTSFIGTRAELFTSWHSSHGLLIRIHEPAERVQWTPGSHVHTVSRTRPSVTRHASTLPTHACTGWCIGSVGLEHIPETHLRDSVRPSRRMDPLGFEPRASSLQRRHSPTELWARLPFFRRPTATEGSCLLSALIVRRCPVGTAGHEREHSYEWVGPSARSRSVGGDPAADSPTATLLRLNPPCEAQIRPALRRPHPDLTRVI